MSQKYKIKTKIQVELMQKMEESQNLLERLRSEHEALKGIEQNQISDLQQFNGWFMNLQYFSVFLIDSIFLKLFFNKFKKMAPRGGGDAVQSVAEMMAATTAEIVRELIDAHKKRKDVNLNKLKTRICELNISVEYF